MNQSLRYFIQLIIALSGSILIIANLQAQAEGKIFINHFSEVDYRGHPQNLCFAIDDNGILFLGNATAGVKMYDGKVWQTVEGLNTSVRALHKGMNGLIYVGGHNDIGYVANESGYKPRFVSLKPFVKKEYKDIGTNWQIHEADAKIYFYTNDVTYVWHNGKFDYIKNEKRYYRQFAVNDKLYLNNRNSVEIEILDGLEPKEIDLKHYPIKRLIAEMLPYNDDEILIVSRYEGLYLYNEKKASLNELGGDAEALLKTDRINCASILKDGNIALGSAFSGIMILDRKGNLLRKINKSSGLIDQTIWSLVQDKNGILWAPTNNGLTKIEIGTGLEYWDKESGLTSVPIFVKRFDNTLYVASTVGVFVLMDKQFHKIPDLDVFTNSIISLENIPGQSSKVLAATDSGIFELKNMKSSKFSDKASYLLHQYEKDPNYLIGVDFGGALYTLHFDGKAWRPNSFHDFIGVKGAWVSSITETKNGDIWFGTEESGVVLVKDVCSKDNAQMKLFSEKENLPKDVAYSVTKMNDELLLYSQKGFYTLDSSGQRFEHDSKLTSTFGFPDDKTAIYPYCETESGDVWLAGAKNNKTAVIGAIKQKDGSFQIDSLALKRIDSKSIVSIYPDINNQVWIGTPDRIYKYRPNKQPKHSNLFTSTINRINVGKDSTLFEGHITNTVKMDSICSLTYSNNFVRFTFGATTYFDSDNTLFSYKLVGYEDEWSDWSTDDYKEFSNLYEGDYTFILRAKNIYDQISTSSKYSFEVLPPWHMSTWAMLIYLFSTAFLVYVLIKLYNQKLVKENERLEAIVQSRTNEVRKQKQSLENNNTKLKDTIAQLTHTQSQLIQSEKMASIGQLTAGIAHEINNPINFIGSSAEALKMDYLDIQKILKKVIGLKEHSQNVDELLEIVQLKKDLDLEFTLKEMDGLFEGIEEGARRTHEIVKGLRIFSRNISESFHLANIHEGIDSTLLILNHQISDGIRVVKEFGNLPLVNCQISKLNQVFLNIIVNAVQAIKSRLKNENVAGRIVIQTRSNEEKVFVKIKDNGIGMSKEISQKIFEPFFTTKDVGEGTGLGLSVSYGIIMEHQGSIELNSELGIGSEFNIEIPIKPDGRDDG